MVSGEIRPEGHAQLSVLGAKIAFSVVAGLRHWAVVGPKSQKNATKTKLFLQTL